MPPGNGQCRGNAGILHFEDTAVHGVNSDFSEITHLLWIGNQSGTDPFYLPLCNTM